MPHPLKKLAIRALGPILPLMKRVVDTLDRMPRVSKGTQILLSLRYQQMMLGPESMPSFDQVGFREFSGTDEDGILLFIFSIIGAGQKRVVDIGSSTPAGSNSANLIINHGWTGLLIEGRSKAVRQAREFYQNHPDTANYPPTIVQSWVTPDNINDTISQAGFSGEMDLLCLDIDSMDYWVLRAIECISPRVVVVEYQDILGPDRAWTVPYTPDFNPNAHEANREEPNYLGASLPAFVKWADEVGYRLVGCNSYGFNAFFVKADIGTEHLPAVPIENCFVHPKAQDGMRDRFPKVADMNWEKV